jgi:hypothetical protein
MSSVQSMKIAAIGNNPWMWRAVGVHSATERHSWTDRSSAAARQGARDGPAPHWHAACDAGCNARRWSFMALEIAQRAYVLQSGEVVLSGSGAELMDSDAVREAYLG